MTPALLAIALTIAVTLGYACLCVAQPFGPCRRCRGMGFQLKQNRRGRIRRGRDCRRCKGTGLRIRIGRHLFNLFRATHRNATR